VTSAARRARSWLELGGSRRAEGYILRVAQATTTLPAGHLIPGTLAGVSRADDDPAGIGLQREVTWCRQQRYGAGSRRSAIQASSAWWRVGMNPAGQSSSSAPGAGAGKA
jgi:hypothetical protein